MKKCAVCLECCEAIDYFREDRPRICCGKPMMPVATIKARVEQLQAELSWIYCHCELRDRDNTHVDSEDVQSAVAAEAAAKAAQNADALRHRADEVFRS